MPSSISDRQHRRGVDVGEIGEVVGEPAKSPCSPPSTAIVPEPAWSLGLQPGQPGPRVRGLVVDAAREAREHLLAHGLGFLDRRGLGGPEQRRGRGGSGRARRRGGERASPAGGVGWWSWFSPLWLRSCAYRPGAGPWLPRGTSRGCSSRVSGGAARRRAAIARASIAGDLDGAAGGPRRRRWSAPAGRAARPARRRSRSPRGRAGTRQAQARRRLHGGEGQPVEKADHRGRALGPLEQAVDRSRAERRGRSAAR